MPKRHQVNITLDERELHNVNEYCRVHGMTPQALFKSGAQRLIHEDILERRADLLTLQSWNEIQKGLAEPIDDLLEMIDEDGRAGENSA
ncbi:hypothetical protein [Geoalkalibacter halelectricus]|uniref:CopG family transcriptional regulator n=1 Tax=Geoalkalibacter halelectricus TaxID=2847045 RepID=A0ABY5ZLD3_9BACT|nr:hypothetical protein [Geoalkalibacter halelectricus]MDO3377148.1 hypothetical protein [Geoalkalibacter halelectricus]UWZ79659.1 hypothetical protein L9S41_18555 [Geoalkalibacter halelectricus]